MTSLEEIIGSHRWQTVHPSLWEPEMNLRPLLGLILDQSTGAISVEVFAIDLEADEWVPLLLRSDDTWDGRKAWADDLLAWALPSAGMRVPIDIPIVYEAPCDPKVGRQLALAEEIMHEDRDILQAFKMMDWRPPISQ